MAKASTYSRGFTLTEVLIVIGIIVLLIGIAIPALGLISGSRSINGAENNVSAMLGRVRADAMGLQREMGVLFFIDPATEQVTLAQVHAVDRPDTQADVYLDLVGDRDFLALPKGVSAQTIDNAALNAGTRLDDGYLGFNSHPNGDTRFGGVILFDGNGMLISKTYGFRGSKTTTAGTEATDLYELLSMGKVDPNTTAAGTDFRPVGPPASQFGLVLFDREAFESAGGNPDPQLTTGGTYGAAEQGEENWLDQNAVPLMINRYNGTLIRGE